MKLLNQNTAFSATDEQNMESHNFVAVEQEDENLIMHNQMQKEDVVACDVLPDWRTSCSFHQPICHPHHAHDMHVHTQSLIHPNPPLQVYYRKRKKIGGAPPLRPQSSTSTLNKRVGKVGKKKISAVSSGKRGEKMHKVKKATEYKAGDMVLRQTVWRLKRNAKEKCFTCKGRDGSSTSIHPVKKNKLKLKADIVSQKATKFKRSGTHSKATSRKLRHKEHDSIHSIFSGMKALEAVVRDPKDEACHKAVEADDKDLATSSTKLKRKKHRPKVQSMGPKAAPQRAQGVQKSTVRKMRLQKGEEKKPLKKRGRPKGSQRKNHSNDGKPLKKRGRPKGSQRKNDSNEGKPLKKRGRPKGSQRKNRSNEGEANHISKKRKVLNVINEHVQGSRGLYVVGGCPPFYKIIPHPCHGNNPSMSRDSTDNHSAAEPSSSASNDLSQLDGNSTQLALAQEHCNPTAVNNNGQIVFYDQRKEMVLFKVPKHFKEVRAEVPIAAENERIWPLLALGGIPSDFEDPQYWEKERGLMKERVMNFILKMHEVQGDRRFSPWKGSVLDSVVGAFLTQNVLDNLSSSAFMSIASRFPPQKQHKNDASQEKTETNAESCPDGMQTSSTTHNLVHVSSIDKSSTLCDESPNKIEDRQGGILQDTCAQIDLKRVCRRLFEKDKVKNKGPNITKQGLTHNKPQRVAAINTSTNKRTLHAKKTHESKLKPITSTACDALKNLKKRNLSYISGIERAHIEENLNGRKNNSQDWESMRKQTLSNTSNNEKRMAIHEDSVDWEEVWHSKVEDLAKAIKERGMHHVLSGRIKAFLKTLKEEHGSTDLEWLRKLSPEDARAYLMSIHGLNVKSTECIRLLTLHHVAFPVDVHVGRVCVRLGWVPIEPLPEQLQLHLLELYPEQETVQKYLWPRLCTLDQKTLYEFHYQLITFGKVFCTKNKPNCHACPMRDDCKHFASAYASAKLLLLGPKEERSTNLWVDPSSHQLGTCFEDIGFPNHANNDFSELHYGINSSFEDFYVKDPFSPIKEATTYENEEIKEKEIMDLEDFPLIYKDRRDFDEELLASINLYGLWTSTNEHTNCDSNNLGSQSACLCHCSCNGEGCFHCLLKEKTEAYHNHPCNHLHSNEISPSKQNVILEEEITNAIISHPIGRHKPTPQLKRVSPSRTIHYVYEIPDMHPLLEKVDPRRKDDPSPYLLVIWRPGEIPQSSKETEKQCYSCSSSHDNPDETILGTLLIPCRSALQGSFPLNGTYFQVNEVFADHESSLDPFGVPRALIWQLRRRFVYFGISITQIFRGLRRDEIQECFSNGYVCVRGFDRRNRAPKPLVCKLHFSKGREQSQKGVKEESQWK